MDESAMTWVSVFMSFATLAITALGGFVAYLTLSLPSRLSSQLKKDQERSQEEYEQMFSWRIQLLDLTLQSATDLLALLPEQREGTKMRPLPGPQHAPATSVLTARDRAYCVQHVVRLASPNQDDVRKSIAALEALGRVAVPYFTLGDRIRRSNSWSAENEERWEILIRGAQNGK